MNITKKYETRSLLLHALGHPVRYCIAEQLVKNECNVSKMTNCLNIPQPTVSQHLQILKAAGIIKGKRDGKEIIYTIIDKNAIKIIELFGKEK